MISFDYFQKQSLGGLQLYLKKALAQVFSSEFWKVSNNTFIYRTPLVAASVFHSFSVSVTVSNQQDCTLVI